MPRFTLRRAAVAVSALTLATPSAPAIDLGLGLFKRKPTPNQSGKPDPATRLKQLLATLQSDTNVENRKAAVEELKGVDPRGNADVFATLAATIQKDPNPGVRAAAAEALGAMRAVSAPAGAALEAAEKNDPDATVRAAAKAALWQYQLNGYKLTVGAAAPGQTAEPPFAKPPAPPARMPAEVTFRPITQGPARGGTFKETVEPPFAKPRTPAPAAAPMPTPTPGGKPVQPPAPAIQPPPLPGPVVAPPTVSVPVAAPPTIPLPAPLPVPNAKPGELPPLTIPIIGPDTAPPINTAPKIVAPPPGTGLPTIVPPGGT